ncbi:MAG: hypothetical protein ABIT04_10600 [Novosphingobium sp.]
MKLPLILVALAVLVPCAAAPAARAQANSEQNQARKDRADGVLPLRQIEGLVVPRMPGMQYLGPEYDAVAKAYRLKFIQNGRVVFVDVDGRTGRPIGNSR